VLFIVSLESCLFVLSALVLGKTISARPAKIIAGHEADKTNELLQSLAEAINKKVCKVFDCNSLLTSVWTVGLKLSADSLSL